MRRNLPPMNHVPGPVLPTAVQMLHQPHSRILNGRQIPPRGSAQPQCPEVFQLGVYICCGVPSTPFAEAEVEGVERAEIGAGEEVRVGG